LNTEARYTQRQACQSGVIPNDIRPGARGSIPSSPRGRDSCRMTPMTAVPPQGFMPATSAGLGHASQYGAAALHRQACPWSRRRPLPLSVPVAQEGPPLMPSGGWPTSSGQAVSLGSQDQPAEGPTGPLTGLGNGQAAAAAGERQKAPERVPSGTRARATGCRACVPRYGPRDAAGADEQRGPLQGRQGATQAR
jgi:hypothetical protein